MNAVLLLLAAAAAWHFLPSILAAKGPVGGITVGGASIGGAAGGLLTGSRLESVAWGSPDGDLGVSFPAMEILGGAPLGYPLTLRGSGGTIEIRGVEMPVDDARAKVEVLVDRLRLRAVEAVVDGRRLVVAGRGTVYPLRRDDEGRAEVHWECLLIGVSAEGVGLAETVLGIPLGGFRKPMDLPTDGLVGGLAGKAVDLIAGWVGEWLGKRSKDYILVGMSGDPVLRVEGVGYAEPGVLRDGAAEDAWRALWSQKGLC